MKKVSYACFREKVFSRGAQKRSLLRVMFELTYRCNFRCPYCYIIPHKDPHCLKNELSTKAVCEIISQLARAGCLYLGFTGGEPLIREDLMDILIFARRRGLEVIIYTNGSLITERMVKVFKKIRVNGLSVSFPTLDPGVFDRLTGREGAFGSVYRALQLLFSYKVPFNLKSCVLKENKGEIQGLRRFARSLGADFKTDYMLMPRWDGSKKPYIYRAMNPLSHTVRKKERRPGRKSIIQCGIGVTQAAITPQGNLKPCLMINALQAKILPEGIIRAWKNIQRLLDRHTAGRQFDCALCSLASYCKWCPAVSWLEHRNFTSCVDEQKMWAQMQADKRVHQNSSCLV